MTAITEMVQALVRPLVTLGFAAATIVGWLYGRLSDDAFLGIAGLVIGFWFQQRQRNGAGGGTTSASS